MMSEFDSHFDTLNWVFSTLPQVLGALVGLMITGVLFLYPSLDRRAARSEELAEVVNLSKKRLHGYLVWLMVLASVCIGVDVLMLIIARTIAEIFANPALFDFSALVKWLSLIALLLNAAPIGYLIYTLSKILHPNFEDVSIDNELKRLRRQAEREERKETQEVQSVSPEVQPSAPEPRRVKISEVQFMVFFKEFEEKCRKYAGEIDMSESAPLRDIVRELYDRKVFSRDLYRRLVEGIKIKNLILHQKSPRFPVSIIHALIEAQKILVIQTSRIKDNSHTSNTTAQ